MNGVVIYAYTREQAIEEGVLVDLTLLARDIGFRWPVAVTRTVWQRCVKVPDDVPCQDETGRAWDILMVLAFATKTVRENPFSFTLSVQNEPGRASQVELKAMLSPGDDGEPVITVMFPEES